MRNEENTIIDLDLQPDFVEPLGRDEETAATDPRSCAKQAIRRRMEQHVRSGDGVTIPASALATLTGSQLYEWLGIDPNRFQTLDPDHEETSNALDRALLPALAA